MSEKKVFSKGQAIGLGVLGIVLAVALIASVFYYSTALSAKDSEITDLHSQIDTKNSQIDDLQSQTFALTAPNLVWSPFEVRIHYGFFMISGFICNTGTETASDVRLHVVAHAVNGTKVIDSYTDLGSINGKQMADVSGHDIYFGGSILDTWTITPEWSDIP